MLSLGSVLRPRTFTLGLFVAISGVVYFLGVLSQCRMYDLWDIDGVWCGVWQHGKIFIHHLDIHDRWSVRLDQNVTNSIYSSTSKQLPISLLMQHSGLPQF